MSPSELGHEGAVVEPPPVAEVPRELSHSQGMLEVPPAPVPEVPRSHRYDCYVRHSGVFPEAVYSRITVLSKKALNLLRQGKLRFIGEELLHLHPFKSPSGYTRVVSNEQLYFFESHRSQAEGQARMAARKGEAWNDPDTDFNLKACPEDIQRAIVIYCIIRENTDDILKSKPGDPMPGTSDKSWTDLRIFGEALLLAGAYERFADYMRKRTPKILRARPARAADTAGLQKTDASARPS